MASAVHEIGNSDLLGELIKLQRRLSKTDFELLVTVLWIICHARNKFVFEGTKIDLDISMAKAEAVREAYKRIQFPDMQNEKNLQKKKQDEWTPPSLGWLKINVDAVAVAKRQCSRLRAMIRDYTGKCIAATIKY